MQDESQRDLAEETMRLLPALVRLLKTTMADQCDMANIPYGQLRVLSHLYQNEGSTVGEVASGLGVSLATASELIDRQVETGWIERSVNPADRRQVILNLSETAADVFRKLHEQRTAQIHCAFERLSPDDRSAFVRGLGALVSSLEESLPSRELLTTRMSLANETRSISR